MAGARGPARAGGRGPVLVDLARAEEARYVTGIAIPVEGGMLAKF